MSLPFGSLILSLITTLSYINPFLHLFLRTSFSILPPSLFALSLLFVSPLVSLSSPHCLSPSLLLSSLSSLAPSPHCLHVRLSLFPHSLSCYPPPSIWLPLSIQNSNCCCFWIALSFRLLLALPLPRSPTTLLVLGYHELADFNYGSLFCFTPFTHRRHIVDKDTSWRIFSLLNRCGYW